MIEIQQGTIKDDAVISLIHRYLNELDKELEGAATHSFVTQTTVLSSAKAERASERVRESITKFIEGRLKLRVNCDKTKSAYIGRLKFLGYGFYILKGKCCLRLHKKSEAKLRCRLKEITSWSNGMGYQRRRDTLRQYLRGWTGYYRMADMGSNVRDIDQWLCRRIRMCITKSWKRNKCVSVT